MPQLNPSNGKSFLEDLVDELGDSRDILNLTEYSVGDEIRIFEKAITRAKEPLIEGMAKVEDAIVNMQNAMQESNNDEEKKKLEEHIQKGKHVLDGIDVALRILGTWDAKKVYVIKSIQESSVTVEFTEAGDLQFGFLDIYRHAALKLKF